MMTEEQQLKLQAFLDGELPETDARAVLSWTQRDREAAGLLAELRNIRQAMAKSESHPGVPETREFYWARIAREIRRLDPPAAAAPEVPPFAVWRRLLFPAGVAAAIVLAGWFTLSGPLKPPVGSPAGPDSPVVETALANSDATTYRDAGEGTTLVWFSSADDGPGPNQPPSAIN